MNKYTKMQLMRTVDRQERRDDDRRYYDRPDMRGGYSGPESRFRDRDGREHYDDGRFAPMSRGGEYGGQPMDWSGYSYPRADHMEPYLHHEMGYPMPPYVPPVYQRGYQTREDYRPMNKIGFSVDGEMEQIPQELGHRYHMLAGYEDREEMVRRQGTGYDMTRRPRMAPVFNRQMAEEWTAQMRNADGTKGPHFSTEKAKEVMSQYNVDCDPTLFWAVINSLYSDYDPALKKHNASSLALYACLAKAWIEDEDAVKDKAAAYYAHVVKH